MAYDITDLLFKLSQNRRPTSDSKRVLEEVAGFAAILVGQQLWNQELDPNPSVSVANGYAVLDTDLVLTADPTTPSGEENSIWLAGAEDYIPPNVVPGDLGYATTLKDDAGIILTLGKLDAYGVLFVHKFGVLLVQDPIGFASEFTFPPKLTAYRYTGTKGAGIIVGVDGGNYVDTFTGVSAVDGGTYL
jgi:hypothetical protein